MVFGLLLAMLTGTLLAQPTAKELALGERMAAEFERGKHAIAIPEVENYVYSLARHLQTTLPPPAGITYKFDSIDDPHATRTPNGESGSDVAARAFAALEPHERWLARAPDAAVVVVTHNHVVRLRVAAQLGIPMANYRRQVEADPGGYSILTIGPAGSTVRRLNVLPIGPARFVPSPHSNESQCPAT